MSYESGPEENEKEQHMNDVLWLPLPISKIASLLRKSSYRYILADNQPLYDGNLLVKAHSICRDLWLQTNNDVVVTLHDLLGCALEKASSDNPPPGSNPGEIKANLKDNLVEIFDVNEEFAGYAKRIPLTTVNPNRPLNTFWNIEQVQLNDNMIIDTYQLNGEAVDGWANGS